MKSFLLIVLLAITTIGFAGSGKSPYNKEPHPFRLYYFGYDLTNPGFGFGPEFIIAWTKMEKSKCTHSARVSDRQLLLAPQLGMFVNESNTISAFGNLELDYRMTFHGGFTFEVFGSGGYAQMLESGETVTNPVQETAGNKTAVVPTEAKSGFMPQAGLGFGYNFQKLNGKNIPFALQTRALATSVGISSGTSIVPAFTAGFTYDF